MSALLISFGVVRKASASEKRPAMPRPLENCGSQLSRAQATHIGHYRSHGGDDQADGLLARGPGLRVVRVGSAIALVRLRPEDRAVLGVGLEPAGDLVAILGARLLDLVD